MIAKQEPMELDGKGTINTIKVKTQILQKIQHDSISLFPFGSSYSMNISRQ